MNGSGRCWWNCRVQVMLILLVVFSGLLLFLASKHFTEPDSMLYEGKNTTEIRDNSLNKLSEGKNTTESRENSLTKLSEDDIFEPLNETTTIHYPTTTAISQQAKRTSILQCEKYRVTPYPIDHILKGSAAQFGEFPYMAALGYGMPNGSDANSPNLFRCGASLISPNYLLTAAHCLFEVPVFARLGVLELQPEIVVDEPLDIAIKKVILHPEYQVVPLRHDIALLELEEPIDGEGPFIQPACLYPNITEGGSLDSQHTLSVQGWGWTDMYESNSTRLMKANVTIIEHKECNSSIPRSWRWNGVFSGMLCALGRNEKNEITGDTCKGDSGGPLELNVDGRHYLVGITSQGSVCGSGIPGIYTEVARYLDWIESIVWSEI